MHHNCNFIKLNSIIQAITFRIVPCLKKKRKEEKKIIVYVNSIMLVIVQC